MLKQYPMLRYVLQKAFWYLLTFVCAVALNFALPRLGDNNPVDIIMGQAGKGLSPTEAQKKKAELLVSFGMAELDKDGNVTEGYKGAWLRFWLRNIKGDVRTSFFYWLASVLTDKFESCHSDYEKNCFSLNIQ